MTERYLTKEGIEERSVQELALIYRRSFAGHPWFEELSEEESLKRILAQVMRPGFRVWVERGSNGRIAGATWIDELTLEALGVERGEALKSFAQGLAETARLSSIVWIRETIVAPEYQGRGVATRLKEGLMQFLGSNYLKGVLVLTRMRDDNYGIIKVNERFGLRRSGIRVRSSQIQGLFHEYWYKVVEPARNE